MDKLREVRYIRDLTREPRDITELANTNFPHVLLETANETRDDLTMQDNRTATIEFLLNIVVSGRDRDSQRNLVVEAIERKLNEDITLGGLAFNAGVSEVLTREIDSAEPFATCALVFSVSYHYDRTQP